MLEKIGYKITNNVEDMLDFIQDYDFEGEYEEGLSYNIIITKTEQGMLANKIIRESPPKELAEIAYASLKELEEGQVGAWL